MCVCYVHVYTQTTPNTPVWHLPPHPHYKPLADFFFFLSNICWRKSEIRLRGIASDIYSAWDTNVNACGRSLSRGELRQNALWRHLWRFPRGRASAVEITLSDSSLNIFFILLYRLYFSDAFSYMNYLINRRAKKYIMYTRGRAWIWERHAEWK